MPDVMIDAYRRRVPLAADPRSTKHAVPGEALRQVGDIAHMTVERGRRTWIPCRFEGPETEKTSRESRIANSRGLNPPLGFAVGQSTVPDQPTPMPLPVPRGITGIMNRMAAFPRLWVGPER
jgi:hypothetical protein